ncbi:MAG: DUF1273 family protein [Clostridia bacterium]|nr:DUF1273 family protein [Clostridia bacterium]
MRATFIGHRTIKLTEKLKNEIEKTIVSLVELKVKVFLFGSKSQFDDICLEILNKLKTRYKDIKCIYVRAEYPYINEKYKNYLLSFYDYTFFPKRIINAGKYSYVERNFFMIDHSTYSIFYFNPNYDKQPSGTKTAYSYAKRKNKNIINLFYKQD